MAGNDRNGPNPVSLSGDASLRRLGEQVRALFAADGFLSRLLPGAISQATVGTGAVTQLAWGSMNRTPPASVVVARLPQVERGQIGVPLVISKTSPSGIVLVQPGGISADSRTPPTVNGLATGFQISAAGQTQLMTDGSNWFTQQGSTGGGAAVTGSGSASGYYPGVASFRLPATHNPVALYHFDGNLRDSSGNGLDMSVEAGEQYYAPIWPGTLGAVIGGTAGGLFSRLVCNASAAATMLALKDDISVEMIYLQQEQPTSLTGFGMAYNDAGGTEASNALWQFNSSSVVNGPQWFQRWGSAPNVANYQASGLAYPFGGRVLLVGARRASGIIRFFLDGKPYGTQTASGLTRPTGGSLSKFRMGGSNSGTQSGRWLTSGVKIMPTGISDQAFLDDYNSSLGQYYGTRE
jgi:hypothetical protein